MASKRKVVFYVKYVLLVSAATSLAWLLLSAAGLNTIYAGLGGWLVISYYLLKHFKFAVTEEARMDKKHPSSRIGNYLHVLKVLILLVVLLKAGEFVSYAIGVNPLWGVSVGCGVFVFYVRQSIKRQFPA